MSGISVDTEANEPSSKNSCQLRGVSKTHRGSPKSSRAGRFALSQTFNSASTGVCVQDMSAEVDWRLTVELSGAHAAI
jgi:hypothetical protein